MSQQNIFKSSISSQDQSAKSPNQSEQYVLTIQYNGKDLPTFQSNKNTQESEPCDYLDYKFDQLEDINFSEFKTESGEKNNFFEYIIQDDDTLFGLELKFNITSQKILEINELSQEGFVYPGMKIKIPLAFKNVFEQGEAEEIDLVPSIRKRSNSFLGVNLLDEIAQKSSSKKFPLQYITNQGSIKGMLTINEDMLFFDPLINEEDKFLSPKNLENKFQASINLNDINEVKIIELPASLGQSGGQLSQEFILQIMLSGIGKKSFEDKYKNKLEKMKLKKTALASIHLRYIDNDQKLTIQQQKKHLQEIADMINSLVYNRQSKSESTDMDWKSELFTSLPYFNLVNKSDCEIDLRQSIDKYNKSWGSCFIPKLLEVSETFNENQFTQVINQIYSKIVYNMPSFFRMGEWKLLFSSNRHGSSLHTLLRQVMDKSPLIFIIKDLNKDIFGAYLSDPLRMHTKFYGSGESYLFTFKNKGEIEVFKWAQNNSDIIQCDSDGIGVGCGDKYGLYINKDLSGGYSSSCTTFMNDPLSRDEAFEVDTMEVWAMDID